jgi:hypothetical protein
MVMGAQRELDIFPQGMLDFNVSIALICTLHMFAISNKNQLPKVRFSTGADVRHACQSEIEINWINQKQVA